MSLILSNFLFWIDFWKILVFNLLLQWSFMRSRFWWFLPRGDDHGEKDAQAHIGATLERCLRDEDEAVEVQLHVHPVDRLLVQDDQPGGTRQEDLLGCGEQSKSNVLEGHETITQLDVVDFLRVGLHTMIQGVETFILNAINGWTCSHSAEEDLPFVDCPISFLVQVVWMSASVEL